jgi:single-strand DNA-binding protein
MASLNKVLLIGNITRDPEKRYTPSGMAVADVGIAVNRKFKASNGEMKDEVCFVTVTLWGKTAENVVEYKRKGDPLFVEGRLKLDQWEKDGQKYSKLTVVGESVQFLNRGQSQGAGGGARRSEYGDAPDGGEPWQGEPADEMHSAPPARNSAPASHPQGGGEKPDDLPF